MSNHSVDARYTRYVPLVDDFTAEIVIIVQYSFVCSFINAFGMATNIINMSVFIQQGLKDSINISLLGLSISDLGSLVMTQCFNILTSPWLLSRDFPTALIDVAYLTAAWPRNTLIRITSCITAFITFERCICISMPLKVGRIITPARTRVVISAIYFVYAGTVAPTYYTTRLIWSFIPGKNLTAFSLVYTEDRQQIDSLVFAINSVLLPMVSFTIVAVCTVILILNLNSKAKWRHMASTSASGMTKKDKKVIKMVTSISSVFILCSFPNVLVFSAVACVPGFNIGGEYHNVAFIAGSFILILESINSSINIFFYYKMSSKYRDTLKLIYTTSKDKKLGDV